jgi:hypothetical protein
LVRDNVPHQKYGTRYISWHFTGKILTLPALAFKILSYLQEKLPDGLNPLTSCPRYKLAPDKAVFRQLWVSIIHSPVIHCREIAVNEGKPKSGLVPGRASALQKKPLI